MYFWWWGWCSWWGRDWKKEANFSSAILWHRICPHQFILLTYVKNHQHMICLPFLIIILGFITLQINLFASFPNNSTPKILDTLVHCYCCQRNKGNEPPFSSLIILLLLFLLRLLLWTEDLWTHLLLLYLALFHIFIVFYSHLLISLTNALIGLVEIQGLLDVFHGFFIVSKLIPCHSSLEDGLDIFRADC